MRAALCCAAVVVIGLTTIGCGAHQTEPPSAITVPIISPAAPITTDAAPADSPSPQPNPSPPLGPGLSPLPDLPARDFTQEVLKAAHAAAPKATLGAVVIDRATAATLVSANADRQFHTASLVKLMIAIDVLGTDNSEHNQQRVRTMLSLSDDNIASALWSGYGGTSIVTRTADRLGLSGTRPPSRPGEWGDTLTTPNDMVKIYQYLLAEPMTPQNNLIVDALAHAPRTAADGFNQYFGIPDGLGGKFAIKQGWGSNASGIFMNSTGLVGDDWRYIVVLLTEHSRKSSFSSDAKSVTTIAKTLRPVVTRP